MAGTIFKRDPDTGAFLWILRDSQNKFFAVHLWTTASVSPSLPVSSFA